MAFLSSDLTPCQREIRFEMAFEKAADTLKEIQIINETAAAKQVAFARNTLSRIDQLVAKADAVLARMKATANSAPVK